MTIEQIVEIPASHRLTIDVPREVPAGRARLAFTPEMDASVPSGTAGQPDRGFRIPLISWLLHRREERFRRAVMGVAGCLANNPAFKGDGVQIIRKMRDEWDRPWDADEKESRF